MDCETRGIFDGVACYKTDAIITMKRKIAVVTGSRAEYGLLFWIIKGIYEDTELELQLLVTGMHLAPQFGMTVHDIERDGFPITERIDLEINSDTEEGVACAMGRGMIKFAQTYERLHPDIVVVLGDRFEIFAAVSAAVPFCIPVAHLYGGDVTEGAIDDRFRHAMTKLSDLHFTSIKEYARRVIQMGEDPARVFCVGATALDNIKRLPLLSRDKIAQDLKIPMDKMWGVLTYHPVTTEKGRALAQIQEALSAISQFPQIYWLIGLPNADSGNLVIRGAVESYANTHPKDARVTASLGQLRYLSLMKHAAVMVGNSSSGIIEAPSFKLPVVNVGTRQTGRVRAQNVIDVPTYEAAQITRAITKALSVSFRDGLQGMSNPYGDGNASENILGILKTYPLNDTLSRKIFHDMI